MGWMQAEDADCGILRNKVGRVHPALRAQGEQGGKVALTGMGAKVSSGMCSVSCFLRIFDIV